MTRYTVTFEPAGKTVEVDPAKAPFSGHGEPGSLLDIAMAHDVPVKHACGGAGVCGKCRIEVQKGMEGLSEADDDEIDTLQEIPTVTLESRLACKAIVRGDVVLRVPEK